MIRPRAFRLLALAALAFCAPSFVLAGPASSDSAPRALAASTSSSHCADQAAVANALLAGGVDRLRSLNQGVGIDACFGPLAAASSLPLSAPASPADAPAAPAKRGGASLIVAALVGIGAITGARSSPRPGVAWAPEWVHTGGPQQIGHSTVLDLSGDFDSLAIRPFELPTPTRFWSVADPPVRLLSQHTPLSAAPRGPPLCA